MGKKLDDDTLTYEKVQHIIDKQLAHIEELHNKERIPGMEPIKDPTDVTVEKKVWYKVFWKKIKERVELFTHKR